MAGVRDLPKSNGLAISLLDLPGMARGCIVIVRSEYQQHWRMALGDGFLRRDLVEVDSVADPLVDQSELQNGPQHVASRPRAAAVALRQTVIRDLPQGGIRSLDHHCAEPRLNAQRLEQDGGAHRFAEPEDAPASMVLYC